MTESNMTHDQTWTYSTIHNLLCKIIEEQNLWGNIVYRILLLNQDFQQEHISAIDHEETRGLHAFEARPKAIERVGLPEVRQYHMDRCISKENEWKKELETAKQTVPEIRPLLLMKIQRRLS